MPMLPLPPERLSATTWCPSASASLVPSVRASVSVLPPGANGTTNRTGRVGYCCAFAANVANAQQRRKAEGERLKRKPFLTTALRGSSFILHPSGDSAVRRHTFLFFNALTSLRQRPHAQRWSSRIDSSSS